MFILWKLLYSTIPRHITVWLYCHQACISYWMHFCTKLLNLIGLKLMLNKLNCFSLWLDKINCSKVYVGLVASIVYSVGEVFTAILNGICLTQYRDFWQSFWLSPHLLLILHVYINNKCRDRIKTLPTISILSEADDI